MNLESDLAAGVFEAHPVEAAQTLERLPPREAGALLAEFPPQLGGRVLLRMTPAAGGAVLARLDASRAGLLLAELPVDVAALLLRQMESAARDGVMSRIPGDRARALGSLLRFPERTAGALMDPEVLGLPQELTAREAIALVRERPDHARYNLYVVDRDQLLVGVLNLRELLLAKPEARIATIMHRRVRRLPADADRHRIVADPGWREVHALPVVDEGGRYLGAVRYRTLRRLEEELRGIRPDEGATARALGALFRAGAAGMLEAVTLPDPLEPRVAADGESDGA